VPSKNTKVILAATAILGIGGAATALTISPADAAPVTETFDVPGALDFTVPEGVCALTVEAFGAEGGVGSDGNIAGLGGHATATIPVTPGETLVVTVGGAGGDATTGSKGGGTAGPGGFNGGADGGGEGNSDPGGGGGGASDVRQGGSDLTDRVVVAGGGGGSGGDTAEDDSPTEGLSPTRGSGGAGGGTEGTPGEDSGFGAGGGGGGTQAAGGAAGVPDDTSVAGSLGEGGQGGDGNIGNDAGGGGGGGYYGGGGGAGDFGIVTAPTDDAAPVDVDAIVEGGGGTSDAGGGGGGSGFGPAGVSYETGVQAGDGVVTITYDAEGETCGPDVLPDDTTPPPVIAGRPVFTG
jgi:hypothetical protein